MIFKITVRYLDYHYRSLQAQLKYTRGGHGRKNKLAKLEKIKTREANFARTVNHQWSAEIVKYAINHHAKYINLEVINSKDLDQYTLRNWSYFQLQEFIKYKANKNGIEVRFVNLADMEKMPADDENLSKEEAINKIKAADDVLANQIAGATSFIKEKEVKKDSE